MNVVRRHKCLIRVQMPVTKKINLFISFCISFLFFSCGDTPAGILNKEKMQQVYWDVMVADAQTQHYVATDSTRNDSLENAKVQQQIFALHQTTREQFYKSLEYYKANPALMNPMLDSMVSKANRDRYSPTNFIKTDSTNQPTFVRPQVDQKLGN